MSQQSADGSLDHQGKPQFSVALIATKAMTTLPAPGSASKLETRFLDLPDECIARVLTCLDRPRDVLLCEATCKRLWRVGHEPNVWSARLRSHFDMAVQVSPVAHWRITKLIQSWRGGRGETGRKTSRGTAFGCVGKSGAYESHSDGQPLDLQATTQGESPALQSVYKSAHQSPEELLRFTGVYTDGGCDNDYEMYW